MIENAYPAVMGKKKSECEDELKNYHKNAKKITYLLVIRRNKNIRSDRE